MDKQFNIPKEKLAFAQLDEKLHDKKFETKPIGYFMDAWLRFKKNKASITAAIIIIAITLFAIIAPIFSPYEISTNDGVYVKIRPRIDSLSDTPFYNGTLEKKINDKFLIYYNAIGVAAADNITGTGNRDWETGFTNEFSPIYSVDEEFTEGGRTYRYARIDSCHEIGFKYLTITLDQYNVIKEKERELGLQIIYPMVDINNAYCADPADANCWYRSDAYMPLDENGNVMNLAQIQKGEYIDNYIRNENGEVMDYLKKDKNMMQVRVLYYNYYVMKTGHQPTFFFGTDAQGYDIFTRLAYGVRLSLLLSISVSVLNLIIGTIYGAIEGFYGGWLDIVLERITEILNGTPFIVVATLFNLHLVKTGKVSTFVGVLFAFVLTGWIGIAYRVRTQFYRFKNQEYVLAAKTLGAKDRRLMFKHILPNSLGTIITSSVLIIPSTIMTESTLSYLGIFNFNSQNMTSLGTLLGNGQGYLATDPHIILFPALVISLLMISFNLFGNGLRDAFNPSLRGVDE